MLEMQLHLFLVIFLAFCVWSCLTTKDEPHVVKNSVTRGSSKTVVGKDDSKVVTDSIRMKKMLRKTESGIVKNNVTRGPLRTVIGEDDNEVVTDAIKMKKMLRNSEPGYPEKGDKMRLDHYETHFIGYVSIIPGRNLFQFTKMKPAIREGKTRVTIRSLAEYPEAGKMVLGSLIATRGLMYIKNILMDIAVKFRDRANITVEVIGKTVEYNDIVIMKMTAGALDDKSFRAGADSADKYAADEPEKKIVFIVHGLNVNGITSVWGLYKQKYFETLLSIYMKHLEKFDIFLIPVANPDGVSETMRMNLWGKNNSPQSLCSGVFLDRNFDIAWNETRDINSCHPRYPGPLPFSEAESRAVRDVIHQYNNKIFAYLNIHAHGTTLNVFKGEAILYPKGYSEVTSDDDKYIDMAGDIKEVLSNVTLDTVPFEMTTLYKWYGKISGSSVDYAAQVYGIPYSLELAMQPYKDKFLSHVYNKYVLEDYWEKIFNVIFTHIHNAIKERDAN